MSEGTPSSQPPPGFKLRHTLRNGSREYKTVIFRIAWSPDGLMLAAGAHNGEIRLWETKTGELLHTLQCGFSSVNSVVWSPDGEMIASGDSRAVRLWDATTGELHRTLEKYISFLIVAWSPDGHTLASGDLDGNVLLWDTKTGELRHKLKSGYGEVKFVAWSPDGQTLASESGSRIVLLWDPYSGQIRHSLEGHSATVYSLAWSPDSQTIASGSYDKTINLWNAKTGQLKITFQGHTSAVKSISISYDGNILASKSNDGTVRLWHCDTGDNIAILNQSASNYWQPSLAFHPKTPVLATLDEEDTVIHLWDLDFDTLLAAPSIARGVSYTNAKVVLVGDTCVGKTGLGVRLAEGVWRPTQGSTHGMNVWQLHSEPEREVMLWDFAGQDEYRLVHQLFLNETNVALMLYDPTKSQDTFFGIDYWERALRNTVQVNVPKILVAARIDVGGVRMTERDIEDYCKRHGFIAHFATSAWTGEGCDELRAAIMNAIPWTQLPRTSSPEVFIHIKDFLTTVRQGNRILMRESDLYAEYNIQAGADTTSKSEFGTVIGHVETAGLIKRLSFGDFILLKPEILNGYAADIVDMARRHPDGLGVVRKADVLQGRINLRDEGGLNKTDKIFLLHATVELFLHLGLALEQDANLVFPSKFNLQMPELEGDPIVEVTFTFGGPVENIYTTLVVKLYYGGIFNLKRLWKNAAEFFNAREYVCGFQFHSDGEGHGAIKVFYAEGVSDDDKALFLKIIADHFKDKRIDVSRERIYHCPSCREVVHDNKPVRRARERNKDRIFCPDCGESIPLVDTLELLYRDDQKFLMEVARMESRAGARMERSGKFVAAAAELRTEDFKQWTGLAEIATVAIVFTDVVGSTRLNVEYGDEGWRYVRDAHFARAIELIQRGNGYLIKTIGDSIMAAFHSAADALDFTLSLHQQTGHKAIRIRVGIHIGPMEVTSDDAFGQQVSMAARIEAKAKDGGIWVSAQIKEDIDILRSTKHRELIWIEHPDEELKGFPQKCTLWSIEYPEREKIERPSKLPDYQ